MKTIKNLIVILVSLFLTSCYSVDQKVTLFNSFYDVNFSRCGYDSIYYDKVINCLDLSGCGIQIYTLDTKVIFSGDDFSTLSTDFGTFEYIDSIKCIRYNEAKDCIITRKAERKAERKRYKFENELKILNRKNCK